MLSLGPLQVADFDLVAGWLSDPAVNRWLTSQWRGREVTATTIAVATRNKRNLMFLVRDERIPVALVALAEIDTVDRCAEVWYALAPSTPSGKGVATEAVQLLVAHALRTLGLNCLYVSIMATNIPSIRVAEKVGFRHAGRLRRAMTFGGEPVDRVLLDYLPAHDPGPVPGVATGPP